MRRPRRQAGFSLVELMVSTALGLFVVLAGLALLVSSKMAYLAQDEGVRLQEAGRHALDVVARAVRQAGYEHWDEEQARLHAEPEFSPNVLGLDARSLKESSDDIEFPSPHAVNGSDVLALRFFGVGGGAHGDGSILNCAGFGVAAPESQAAAEDGRGWSIFYVAKGIGGEPELRCKYRGKKAWTSDALVAGVESFQVLYGIDLDGDGIPNGYLNADAIETLDDRLLLQGPNAVARALDRKRKTHWKKVVAVQVALLLRGAQAGGSAGAKARYDLFGLAYGEAHAGRDIGTRIQATDLPAATRDRVRKLVAQTIQLRNRSAGAAAIGRATGDES
ncbi:MAG TPA: PilW family protein [Paucimonas sp.]|nr:PilW family protein [Paucimonas sp.]